MKICAGTSGYSYDYWASWRAGIQNFFPENVKKTDWLEYYSLHCNSIEINCTRYRKLRPTDCEKWYNAVDHNPNFTFVIKVDTYVTHKKKLVDISEWWENMKTCISELHEKFFCLLFQFPPAFKKTDKNLYKLEQLAKLVKKVKCAFEFRDLAWYKTDDELYTRQKKIFLRTRWTVVTLHVPEVRGHETNFGNLPGGIHSFRQAKKKFVYHRFHGTISYSSGLYSREYIKNVLDTLPKKTRWAGFYFNNVDTFNQEGIEESVPYNFIIPVHVQLYPSAIQDCLYIDSISRELA